MTMNKIYVDNLIPGRSYRVVDTWDLDNKRRHFRLEFNGIYVRRHPFGNIIRVVFLANGRERIINYMNEFYLIPSPPMKRNLITQINRNVGMQSNAEERDEWIDDSVKMFKPALTFPEDIKYYISKY